MPNAHQPTQPDQAKFGRLSVLDKMIAQDLLVTLASVWSVIVVIIVSREFVRVLDKAVQGDIPSDVLAILLGLKTITVGIILLAPAAFMAILMVLGRMYRDQEMSALFAAGGGTGIIYRAVFLVIFPITLFAGWCSFYAVPWAEAQNEKIVKQGKQSADLRGIAAGKFSDYSHGELVFYVESISQDNILHKVFVEQQEQGKQGIINAETATLQDRPEGRYIVFNNGQRIQGQPGKLDYTIEQFKQYAVRVASEEMPGNITRLAGMKTGTLWDSHNIYYISELQRRLAIPISLPLLAFIGVPLAQSAPRGGIYGNIVVGFLIYFSYGNLVRVSQVWVEHGAIPVWLGAIAANILLLLIGGLLLGRFYGWRWLLLKAQSQLKAAA